MSLTDRLVCVEIVLNLAVLSFLILKRHWKSYWAVGVYLAVRAGIDAMFLALVGHGNTPARRHQAYTSYFHFYWPAFAMETVLVLCILYSLLGKAMGPMDGLRRLGKLLFGWGSALFVMLALGLGYATNLSGNRYFVFAISKVQQIQSVLMLGLLMVVAFAIWKLGLSLRSKVFGVSVGLGLMAVTDLVQSIWLPRSSQAHTLVSLLNGGVVCAVLVIWAVYFAMREPGHGRVALDPDSKLMRLNAWYLQQRA